VLLPTYTFRSAKSVLTCPPHWAMPVKFTVIVQLPAPTVVPLAGHVVLAIENCELPESDMKKAPAVPEFVAVNVLETVAPSNWFP
jgi:hypothetical protein